MIAYTAVALIIETAGTLMGTSAPSTVSQEDGRTSNTTNNTTNQTNPTPDGPDSGSEGPAPGSTGTAADACMRWYSGPPARCYTGGGSCPLGANTIEDLFRIWGARLPGGSTPASQAACRSCITTGLAGLNSRYPGLDLTCMPAVVSAWITDCGGACNGTSRSGSGTEESAARCTAAAYNDDSSCRACILHATAVLRDRPTSEEARTINSGSCPTPGGNVIVWCANGHPGWSAMAVSAAFEIIF